MEVNSVGMHFLVGKHFGDNQDPGNERRSYPECNVPFFSRGERHFAPACRASVAEPPAVPDDPKRGRGKNCRNIAQCIADGIGMDERHSARSSKRCDSQRYLCRINAHGEKTDSLNQRSRDRCNGKPYFVEGLRLRDRNRNVSCFGSIFQGTPYPPLRFTAGEKVTAL